MQHLPQLVILCLCVKIYTTLDKKLSNRHCLISIMPITTLNDAHHRHTGSTGISFKVKNCQARRPIRFKWLKPDFTEVISGTDINVGGETEWVLVLKMTPIE